MHLKWLYTLIYTRPACQGCTLLVVLDVFVYCVLFWAVFSDQVNGGVATSGAYQLTSPTGHSVLVSPNVVQPTPPPAKYVVDSVAKFCLLNFASMHTLYV